MLSARLSGCPRTRLGHSRDENRYFALATHWTTLDSEGCQRQLAVAIALDLIPLLCPRHP
jgi:hypothetical protein